MAATVLFVALLLRLAFIVYGEWQDRNMTVKYTDVDYNVFTDAAAHVVAGKSPYLRSTYRYTPLLALALTPNVLLHRVFGKLVFSALDVFAGYLIFSLLCRRGSDSTTTAWISFVWLFNPLVIMVSTRGNAESVVAVLVLATIRLISNGRVTLAALFYGLAVHFKLYPIIYSLPLYLYVGGPMPEKPRQENINLLTRRILDFAFHPLRLKFGLISFCTFIWISALMYYWYGFEFLEHTYLYHVTRRDVKHNFSVYFYMLYLVQSSPHAWLLGLLAFIPQLVMVLSLGLRFYRDIAFCCFVQTFAFVALNKVCTSQYFIWYLCLLPLISPSVRLSLSRTLLMTCAWFSAQAIWLIPAYYLEFEGRNTMVYVWVAGLAFFSINMFILWELVRNHQVQVPVIQKAEHAD